MQIRSLLSFTSDDDSEDEIKKSPLVISRRSYKMFKRQKSKSKGAVEDKGFAPASYLEMMRYATWIDWMLVVVGLLFSSTSGALGPAGCIIFKGITNALMKGQVDYSAGNLDLEWFTGEMLLYIQMYLYLALLIFILEYVSVSFFFTLCERQVHQIRKKFLRSVLNQDISWFDKNEVGKLTQKMSSGIDRIQIGSSDKLLVLVRAISAQISGIVIAFTLNWQMTIIMIFMIPFVILTILGSSRSVKKALEREQQAYGLAGAVVEEVINGIRTVLAFNAQTFESNRYTSLLLKGCKNGMRKALLTALFSGLYSVILFGSMGVAFWFGTNLVIDGIVSPGTVFAVFWSVLAGSLQLGQALPQIGILMGSRISASEIFSIIDRKPKLDCTSLVGVKPVQLKGRIEFSNIQFSYPTRSDVEVLKKVSFTVEPGQTVALVGHSGCGKSTIVNLLLRYYKQNQGSVMLDGIPLEDLNVGWLRSRIGLVSQEPVIFAATVEENIRIGKEDLTEDEMVRACIDANIHDTICKLPNSYQTRIGEGGIRLSGGQKQRLAIARALVKNPQILLLDEATSALDTESERFVQAAIDKASSGRTTITIAHRLSTIRNADKIIVFDNGSIVETGTHEELIELDGIYKQLVLAQEIIKNNSTEDDIPTDDSKDDQLTLSQEKDLQEEERVGRSSRRLCKSLILDRSLSLTPTTPFDIEDKKQELEDEKAEEASLLTIWRFSRPEQRFIFMGLFCTIFRGLSTPLFSILYGQLFNSLSTVFSEEKTDIATKNLINGMSFALLGLFSGITTFFSGTLFGYIGERLSMRLRSDVFSSILRQDGKFFDDPRHSTGILTTRLATDAPNVQAAIDQRLAEVLQSIIALVFGIAIAFYFGWTMAPIGILTAVFIVIVQLTLTSYLKRRSQQDVEIAEEASQIAIESIEYVKTVQALTLQHYVNETFDKALKRPHKRALMKGFLQALNYGLMATFVNLNFGCAYLFGLILVRNDLTTPFVVFQVIEALNVASISIMMAANYFPEYLRARVSAGLMFKLINSQPQVDSMSDGGKKPLISGHIALKNVYFAYPNNYKQLVLRDFSVEVACNQTLALVGPSGCGKSTTIQLLERYYDILVGRVEIDGVDIREINLKHLRQSMALVGQEPILFNLTIAENIAYGLEEVSEDQIIEAAKLANVHDFVDSLPKKYKTMCGARGTQLSGGQKQRICIARAIIRRPSVLMLDEATSALDTQSERIVQEALDRARQGRTCITIAHRLSTIQNADIIAVVKDGRLAEMGNHQQLLNRRELYYRLVQKQSS